MKTTNVPISEKFALTITEASEYFGVGEKKLRQIVLDNQNADFYFRVGVKVMIKRELFSQFLVKVSSI